MAIIREERQQYVSERMKESKFTFSFPMVKNIYSENEIFTYEQGEWEKELELISQKTSDWTSTVFCLIFPIIGILIISLLNQLKKIGSKKLLIFYGAILSSMALGGFTGVFAGVFAGVIAGVIVGVIAGVIAGGFASGITGVFTIIFAGGFASGLTSMFVGGFAG